ncbi:KpsF/GutQ family sugar-phosphate isomerase [Labrenzia aggregata]|uniref:KpsF/GutQ family sugar-phosphate isomerase n=2 Tax=Roseibium aggregatum TaxID=187304 RepID=A0A926NXW5_9HYPH|nr:KpsF/GutQ family sugar-phosphate isomerase [Roseibium aggregatum]MBD1548419.1 KpsF/GutQ family sugar-phosphate isomerase [Roseibium aggregatum]
MQSPLQDAMTTSEQEASARPLVSAERTLETEIAGLSALRAALKNGLSAPFTKTVELIAGIKGRVIVSGIGKSGHIGTKLAATLASTGTPAFFVHASEASHGDLGMITQDDVVIALSWSGETQELAGIVTYTRRFKVPLVAITKSEDSTLGRAADIVLKMPSVTEACPHGLAPTTSALVQLAAGDALAIALLEYRGFTAQDFRIFHPGGRLGASLTAAQDIMHKGDALPLAPRTMVMRDAIVLMTQKGFGVLGIVDEIGHLIGIITDGDLRRHISTNFLDKPVTDIMTPNPKSIPGDMLSAAVLELINSSAITSVFVADEKRPVGIIHLHDLLRIGAA